MRTADRSAGRVADARGRRRARAAPHAARPRPGPCRAATSARAGGRAGERHGRAGRRPPRVQWRCQQRQQTAPRSVSTRRCRGSAAATGPCPMRCTCQRRPPARTKRLASRCGQSTAVARPDEALGQRAGPGSGAAARTTCDSPGAGVRQRQVGAPHRLRQPRACGCGCGEVSISSAAMPPARSRRAAASASALGLRRGRRCRRARRWRGRRSAAPRTGVSPRRRTLSASARGGVDAAASGVPPPPGRPARLRLARTSERVGGSSSSAPRPRKASTATLSRRT